MDSGHSAICFPGQLVDDMNWLLAGIVTSTIVYGFNFIIAIICFRTLLKGRKRDDSNKQPTALCIYIIGIFGLGTAAVVHSNLAIVEFGRIIVSVFPGDRLSWCNLPQFAIFAYKYRSENLYNLVVSPSLPVTIWAADGILIWRYFALYQAVSRPKQAFMHLMLVLFATLLLASGAYSVWSPPNDHSGNDIALKAASHLMLPSTIALNTLVSGLIAARLLYAQRLLKISVTNRGGNYTVKPPFFIALAICIESGALIVAWAIVLVITTCIAYGGGQNAFHYSGWHLIPITIFPQICIMSALFIVYQVASCQKNDSIAALEDSLTHISIAPHHMQPNAAIVQSKGLGL